jgi:hypothetical protein
MTLALIRAAADHGVGAVNTECIAICELSSDRTRHLLAVESLNVRDLYGLHSQPWGECGFKGSDGDESQLTISVRDSV